MKDEPIEDFEFVDYTTNAEFIASACNAIAAIDGMDEGLLATKEKTKLRLIRSKSIAIIYACINELYEERFPPPEDSEGGGT